MLIWQKVFGDSNFIINLYISLTIFMIQTMREVICIYQWIIENNSGSESD